MQWLSAEPPRLVTGSRRANRPSVVRSTLARLAVAPAVAIAVAVSCATATLADTLLPITANTNAPAPLAGHLKLGTPEAPDGQRLTANSLYFERNGEPWLPVMGEIHFARCPREDWEQSILAMKAGGVQIVATYVFWIFHEAERGQYDWSDNRDLRHFVQLCQKHDVYVWLRVGPWCHGEARNGGFPDWLPKVCRPRTMDPAYFAEVRRWYAAIAQQAGGLLFKDGGPVIGIQFDNEYGHVGGRGEEGYIPKCKQLARELGLDTPYYSVTGWGGAFVPRDEVLPFQGSYADAAWASGVNRLPPPKELMFGDLMSLVRDTTVAADVMNAAAHRARLRYDPSRYPYSTAELGGGMVPTLGRRPIIDPLDTAAMALARLGEGANLLGYYMYHGGSQPYDPRQWLGEPKYPRLCYDYQAPLGEFGKASASYFHLKRLHQFLADFGGELARLMPSLPADPPDADDSSQLRYALRSDGRRGFLLFNNHQRYLEMPARRNVRFAVQLADSHISLPSTPVTIGTDVMGIWPINLSVEDATIEYASAMPLMRLATGNVTRLVFAATPGVQPELCLRGTRPIGDGSAAEQGGRQVVKASTGDAALFTTIAGKQVELLVLSPEDSLRAWRIQLPDGPRLALCDAEVWQDDDGLVLRSVRADAFDLRVYPTTTTCLEADCALTDVKRDGAFSVFTIAPLRTAAITVRTELASPPEVDKDYWNGVDIHWEPVRQAPPRAWRLRIEGANWTQQSDVLLRISYLGDIARLYLNGRLIADDFWKGTDWVVGLKRWRAELSRPDVELTLVIAPWIRGQPTFVERPPQVTAEATAELTAVIATPEWRHQVSWREAPP